MDEDVDCGVREVCVLCVSEVDIVCMECVCV